MTEGQCREARFWLGVVPYLGPFRGGDFVQSLSCCTAHSHSWASTAVGREYPTSEHMIEEAGWCSPPSIGIAARQIEQSQMGLLSGPHPTGMITTLLKEKGWAGIINRGRLILQH